MACDVCGLCAKFWSPQHSTFTPKWTSVLDHSPWMSQMCYHVADNWRKQPWNKTVKPEILERNSMKTWSHTQRAKCGHYEGVSKSSQTESMTKQTTINILWEATQGVMEAKLTRLTHKIARQLHLVAESCTICSPISRRPVRKLLDTPSYTQLMLTE